MQIDDLVKNARGIPVGTTLHETAGHWIEPDRGWPAPNYRLTPVFRYRFGGIMREGKKLYVKIEVGNVFLQKLATSNRAALTSSKASPSRSDAITSPAWIELLVLLEEGKARFEFPVRVITASTQDNVELAEAMMEFKNGKFVVSKVTRKFLPASKLFWYPPKDWPSNSQTIYLDVNRPDPAKAANGLKRNPPEIPAKSLDGGRINP